jgi:hypothetical protein
VIIAGGMSEGPAMQVFADAAAYSPATRTWRRLPPMPEPRWGATAVWDGTEVLLIGGTLADAGGPASDGVAFNPATGRWRRLPGMEVNRSAFAAVWTGRQVLVWGGLTGTFQDQKIPPHGVAYDPAANRWSAMPTAPLARPAHGGRQRSANSTPRPSCARRRISAAMPDGDLPRSARAASLPGPGDAWALTSRDVRHFRAARLRCEREERPGTERGTHGEDRAL